MGENDLVFITNGGCVENSSMGSQTEPAAWAPEIKPGGGWDMWRRIAEQDPSFGHPDVFCSDPEHSKWMSATVDHAWTTEIPPYIQKICKRDPFSGRVVTGGIVTVEDSNWLMSWTLNRQQQFRDQPKDQLCVWVYGLFPDKPGNYVKKPMQDCTGEEICEEWLYHMGVPTDKIADLATNHANTVPVMMPYIDAFFMPRSAGDRPDVVPDGAVNFAFLGQFAETPRDTIFTTEYSMRTGMEAVYTLCDVDRGVPEVWGSVYDVRNLLNATVMLRDGKPITDMKLNPIERTVLKQIREEARFHRYSDVAQGIRRDLTLLAIPLRPSCLRIARHPYSEPRRQGTSAKRRYNVKKTYRRRRRQYERWEPTVLQDFHLFVCVPCDRAATTHAHQSQQTHFWP